ncbi:MAG: GDSL-type esterase/lipase family protein [Paludibacter sp.]|nr:GDSL-type esterase/lipase family protein [Paludibacter sp.]
MKKNFIFLITSLISLIITAQDIESLTLTINVEQYKALEKHFIEKEKAKLQATDWARFYRYEAMNDSLHKPAKVVFLGNSITDGWYRLHPEFFIENGFTGRGIGGQTTSHMLTRFQADVIDLKPKIVVIMAGTNDIARNNGIITHKHIMQNIKSMCELAKYHKIKPILCSILPAHEFRWNKELEPAADIKLLNDMIREYAQNNKIPFADYYAALVDDRGGLPTDIAADGVHPNMNGYAIMEPIILKSIRKIL